MHMLAEFFYSGTLCAEYMKEPTHRHWQEVLLDLNDRHTYGEKRGALADATMKRCGEKIAAMTPKEYDAHLRRVSKVLVRYSKPRNHSK